jgi:hypothetical protein
MSVMRGGLIVIAAGVLALCGCGGPDPSCKDAITKASKLQPARELGVTEQLIGVCERQEWAGDLRRCFAGAVDRASLMECLAHRPEERRNGLGHYRTRVMKTEAQLQLDKIGKAAKVAYLERAQFPTEAAPLTPSDSCCIENFQDRRRCRPDASRWSAPAWRALDFEISTPHAFRYSYTPSKDGTSFTATAVGDLDCDGVDITFTLHGRVVNGNPETKLVEPPRESD